MNIGNTPNSPNATPFQEAKPLTPPPSPLTPKPIEELLPDLGRSVESAPVPDPVAAVVHRWSDTRTWSIERDAGEALWRLCAGDTSLAESLSEGDARRLLRLGGDLQTLYQEVERLRAEVTQLTLLALLRTSAILHPDNVPTITEEAP